LSSEKYLTALESELSSKQQSIEAKIQSLPKKEELEALELKIKNTTLDKNPLEAAKQLKGFKEDIVDELKSAGKDPFSVFPDIQGLVQLATYKFRNSLSYYKNVRKHR
jgi:hypothetical protein